MTTSLHCADALDVLRGLDGGSVDCIITDPPYPTISGGKGGTGDRPSGMLAKNDGKIFEHNSLRARDYMHDLFRVLRDPGHVYVMTNFLNLEETMKQMRMVGFGLHNLLVARKQNATPNRWYMKNVEYTILGRKGAAFQINDCGSMTCHDWTNPVGKKLHETEKSVELMQGYVENSTQPGETVLDPFMGAGATGVACQRVNRNFIGIEIDQTYYSTACDRMGVMP